MANVIRYFSTSGAGAADGTTWADRAALFTGGAWSTVITGFAFTAGSDGLECRIGPGTYTITTQLSTGAMTAGNPSASKPLRMVACDSSGNAISPPDLDWTADMPDFSQADMPILATTTNTATINIAYAFCRMLKFTATAVTSAPGVIGNAVLDWCYVSNSASGANVCAASVYRATNSIFYVSGSQYAGVLVAGAAISYRNLRVYGVVGSSGNRRGIVTAASTSHHTVTGCCVFGVGGGGIRMETSTANSATAMRVDRNTVVNVGGDGIYLQNTATPLTVIVDGNCVTGSGGYGINGAGGFSQLTNNRTRDNTSGNVTALGNYTEYDGYTTDAADADDYFDPTNYDFRIRADTPFSFRGIGVSQIPTGGAAWVSRALDEAKRRRFGRAGSRQNERTVPT